MKSITFHSYKGGTGKTTLAANIAVILAQAGHNVALLDMDFTAPSLHTLFGISDNKAYLNDYVDNKAKPSDILINVAPTLHLKSKLLISFSNPNVGVIREQLSKDRKWQMKALSQLLILKKELETRNIDYLILDSSPGIHYGSVNAIVISDFTILVSKVDNFDFDGIVKIIDDLYNTLDKKTYILFNKVVMPLFEEPNHSNMMQIIDETFKGKSEIMGFIPCYCTVPLGMGSEIFAITQPNLPFVQEIKKIAKKLEEINLK